MKIYVGMSSVNYEGDNLIVANEDSAFVRGVITEETKNRFPDDYYWIEVRENGKNVEHIKIWERPSRNG